MSHDTVHVLAYGISYGLSALVLGWLAARKNRDRWAWGLIGGFFCLPCLIALAFLPYLCPKCKRPLTNHEWERGECPTCGGRSAEPTVCLSCGAAIPGGATACPQCGWSYKSGAGNEDPDALLSEAARLESNGDTAGALATYEAVRERFPGTEAAKDAEASIRRLKEIQRPTNMANYKIIGADLIEYGPVSAEQIRQWITERRVDSETKLQAEGASEWKRLAEVPEFAEPSPPTGPSTCPNCGEPFEDRLDSCWKCGTRRDGSRLKPWTPVDDAKEAAEQREPCPKCGSTKVSRGKLLPSSHSIAPTFQPEGTRIFFSLLSQEGVDLSSDPSFACLDCGLVWDYLRPEELKEFISKHCGEDAYALLSEAVRLESKGDTAGAVAKYEAVMEKFPGTGAAGDAEISIRNLRDKG